MFLIKYYAENCKQVTRSSGAQLIFVSETNAEDSEEIAISGFHINVSFDQGLPFFNHEPQFICDSYLC